MLKGIPLCVKSHFQVCSGNSALQQLAALKRVTDQLSECLSCVHLISAIVHVYSVHTCKCSKDAILMGKIFTEEYHVDLIKRDEDRSRYLL